MSTEKEIVREAMRIIGRAKTERKLQALEQNRLKFTGHTEETKTRLREAQQARRERELAERVASGTMETTDKKPVGRPRKQADPQAGTTPKRGRGRPKKQTGETLPMEIDGA